MRFITTMLTLKVSIAKYIPLNLRATRPITSASAKFISPAKSTMTGKGKNSMLPAAKYSPIPKKAADPKEMYFVEPEKKCQLTESAIHMRTSLKIDK
jgi:hypothetical protein